MKETLNSKLYILVVIGIVSAFGPFVTDFTCQPFRCWPDILILRHRSYSLA